jgi:fatty acid synthase
MGIGLFRRFEIFRRSILECESIYKEYTGESLIYKTGLFIGPEPEKFSVTSGPWPTHMVSAAIVFFQIALFDLMKWLGLNPDIIIGHSLGECAVMYASGAMSKTSVIQIASARGRALELLDGLGGGLAALTCSPREAKDLIQIVEHDFSTSRQLHIAAYNSPGNVAISGPGQLVDYLVDFAQKWHMGRVKAKRVRVNCAMHSPFVNGCERQYRRDLARIFAKFTKPCIPTIPVISTVTGDYLKGEYTIDYLWDNMRQPVKFTDAIRKLVSDFEQLTCIEFSPHPVLGAYIKEMGPENVLGLISHARGDTTEIHSFLSHLGAMVSSGVNCINFAKLNGEPKERLVLRAPAYPFQYKMKLHWADPVPEYYRRLLPASRPLNSPRLSVSPELPDVWMGQHVIDRSNLVPASVYMEIAFEFPGVVEIYDVQFKSAFSLDNVNLSVSTFKVTKTEDRFEVCSSSQLTSSTIGVTRLAAEELEWARVPELPFDTLHSMGKLSYKPTDTSGLLDKIDIANFMSKCTSSISGDAFYDQASEVLQFGPEFKRLIRVHWDSNHPYACMAYIRGAEMLETHFQFHPVLSDAMIQAAVVGFNSMTDKVSPTIQLPHSVKRVFRNGWSTEPLLLNGDIYPIYCRLVEWNIEYIVVDVFLLDNNGDGECLDIFCLRLCLMLIHSHLIVLYTMAGLRNNTVKKKEIKAIRDRYTIAWQPVALPVTHSVSDVEMVQIRSDVVPIEDQTQLEQLKHLDELAETYMCSALKCNTSADLKLPPTLQGYSGPYQKRDSFEETQISEECLEQVQSADLLLHGFARAVADSLRNTPSGNKQELQCLPTHEQIGAFLSNPPFSKTSREALVQEVLQLIREAGGNGKKVVRIVELNAATGDLTEVMSAAISADNTLNCHVEYCCTDADLDSVSLAVSRGRYKFMTAHCLDLSSKSGTEKFISADIVFGINIPLGSSPNHPVARNLKRLLVPGGWIVLLEPCGTKEAIGSTWSKWTTLESEQV